MSSGLRGLTLAPCLYLQPTTCRGDREMEGWVPEPTKRVYWVRQESLGVREEATEFRDANFPPREMRQPTAAVIDFSGMPTANPGRIRELVLPVAQGIRGGVYGP